MSEHDETMERLNWLVKAVTQLLLNSGDTPVLQAEGPVEEYENEPEPERMVESAPAPVQAVCTHGQQAKRGDAIVCAKCGFVIIPGTGIGGTSSQLGVGPV